MNKKITILLCSSYHISSYFGGGNEQHIHHLALGLKRTGHEVIYFCSGADNKKYPYKLVNSKMLSIANKPLIAPLWFSEIRKIDFDIFHAFGSGIGIVLMALYVKIVKRKKTILTFQAPINPSNFLFSIAGKIEEFVVSNIFNGFITSTKNNENFLRKKWKDKIIKFIPLPLPEHIKRKVGTKKECREKLNLPIDKNIVLFVGKLSSHQYYKGVEILLKTSKLLSENYLVLIIGNGDKENYYKKLAEKMNIEDKLKFLGFVKNIDLANYYKCADVFVLPSTSNSEGFGLSLIEAMFHKVPTITTKVVGSARWFEKEAGSIIINENNDKDLARAIIKIVKGKKKEIKKGKEFAESFTVEKMTKLTLDFHYKICKLYS